MQKPQLFTLLAFGAACLLTLAVYMPGMRGGFALDDYTNIVNNGALAIQSLAWSDLTHAVFSFQAGPLMRPISMLTFALNEYVTGNAPLPFKTTNLVIHLVNGMLVMLFLLQLLRTYRVNCAPLADSGRLDFLAAAAAGLWLLHPLNAMPVLYVVQRETALSTFFMLIGLNLHLRGRMRRLEGKRSAGLLWIGLPSMTALAVLCKESGALLPVYAAVTEIFLFRFRTRDQRLDWGVLSLFAAFLVFPALLGLLWALFGHGGGVLSYAGRDFSLGERLLSETRVVWLYIRWTLIPDPRQMGLYHDDIAISHGLFRPVTTLWSLLGIAALIVACVALRRRLPLLAFGIAWFLGGQLMESTIFPLELVYEHRCYLADLGPMLAVLSLLMPLRAETRLQAFRYVLAGLAVALCATMTWVRSYDWRDNLTFAAAEARHHPQSPYATYMLGQTYANLALMDDPQQYDNAVASLRTASLVPNSTVIADVSLVLVQAQLKGKVDPDVLPRIAAKVADRKLAASDIQGLAALGECVDKGNCVVDPAAMQAIFETALRNPHLADERGIHANILVIYGNYVAYSHHDLRAARKLMGEAADLVPTEPQYQENKVTMDISLRDRDRALEDLSGLRKLNYLGHLDQVIAALQAQIDALPARSQP